MRIVKNEKLIPIFDMSRALPAFYLISSLTSKEKTDLIKAYDFIFREDERRRRVADEFIKKNFEA